MSKESLEKLNKTLLKHFEETGVKDHPSRISYDDMLNNIEIIYEAVYHNNYISI